MVKHIRHGHKHMYHAKSQLSRFANTPFANARVPVAAGCIIQSKQATFLKGKSYLSLGSKAP
jgi:hypothetical protein